MPEPRRRPKNRKAQIASVAAEAFSEQGYHAVGMDDIAHRVGVSAAALYRHFPSKYDLFRSAVLTLGQRVADATAFVDGLTVTTDDAAEVYDGLVSALVDVGLANRGRGGVYRWAGRYLADEDLAVPLEQYRLVNRRLQIPMRVLRPELGSRERWTLSVSVLAVLVSMVDHHSALSPGRIQGLFGAVARALLWTSLPAGPVGSPAPAPREPGGDAGRFEAILRAAMALFLQNGYRQTTIESIARAVGMPASGIYRYFPGKADILTAVFRRSADRVSAETAEILAAGLDPQATLDGLVHSYVAWSFGTAGLDSLYFVERPNLRPSDGVLLHNMQRANVDAWVRVLTAARPGLAQREARFVVHAAFAVVVDVGALAGHADTPAVRAMVETLMTTVLLAPPLPVLLTAGP